MELLAALQCLFFAVGFHLHPGGAVLCVDKQEIHQAHGIDGSCLGRSHGWGLTESQNHNKPGHLAGC